MAEPEMPGALGQREILQAVEDVLVDAGWDEMMWATEHGSFTWRSVERSREAARGVHDMAAQIVLAEAGPRPPSWQAEIDIARKIVEDAAGDRDRLIVAIAGELAAARQPSPRE